MSALTAIDVLTDPDDAAIDPTRVVNARLLTSIPAPDVGACVRRITPLG